MPRRGASSREQLLEGALDVLRRRGPGALSARNLAERVGCSTQPIYSAFSCMKDLERALLRAVRQTFRAYLAGEHGGASPFENVGLGYLRFAREEPQLFNWLIGSGRLEVDLEARKHAPELALAFARMAQDPSLAGLAPRQIRRLQRDLWIYTHGLAVLGSSGMLRSDEATARGYLNAMAATLIAAAHAERRKR